MQPKWKDAETDAVVAARTDLQIYFGNASNPIGSCMDAFRNRVIDNFLLATLSDTSSFGEPRDETPSDHFWVHAALSSCYSAANQLQLMTKVTSMPGVQAKILSDQQVQELLCFADTTRYPARNRLIVLLSVKAGLRAGEIAKLTWEMLIDPEGNLGGSIELRDHAAKKGSGRRIPIHPILREAMLGWRDQKTSCRCRDLLRTRRPDGSSQYRQLVRRGISYGRP